MNVVPGATYCSRSETKKSITLTETQTQGIRIQDANRAKQMVNKQEAPQKRLTNRCASGVNSDLCDKKEDTSLLAASWMRVPQERQLVHEQT